MRTAEADLAAKLKGEVHQTRFQYPAKVRPGCYEVVAWVAGSRLAMRFRTERDAFRFFWASERGEGIAS